MMKHDVEPEELQAYLDDELAPARRAALDLHLAACADCRALVADLRRVSDTLQRWQVEPAPATLAPPPLASKPVRLGLPWQRWALALSGTAAVVLLFLAVFAPELLRQSTTSPPSALAPQGDETAELVPQPSPPETPPDQADDIGVGLGPPLQQKSSGRVVEKKPAPEPPAAESWGRVARVKPPARLFPKEWPATPPPAPAEGEAGAADQVAPPAAPAAAERAAREQEEDRAASAQTELRLQSKARAPESTQPQPAPVAPPVGRAVGGLAGTTGLQALRSERAHLLVAYEVALTLEVKEFEPAREKLHRLVEEAGGYVSQGVAAETPGQARRADFTLRVPAEKLAALVAELRALGRVTREELTSEEVADQLVDLDARLRNARATEQRLLALLEQRTGKVADLLEAERELARTRETIERLDARRQHLLNRVELATLTVTLLEEFKAALQPAPTGTSTRLRNALVEGYENFTATLLALVLFFARYTLTLVFWFALGFLTWRALRPRLAATPR